MTNIQPTVVNEHVSSPDTGNSHTENRKSQDAAVSVTEDSLSTPQTEHKCNSKAENVRNSKQQKRTNLPRFRPTQKAVLISRKTERTRRAMILKNLKVISKELLRVPTEPVFSGMSTIMHQMNQIMKEREQRFSILIGRVLDQALDRT